MTNVFFKIQHEVEMNKRHPTPDMRNKLKLKEYSILFLFKYYFPQYFCS